MSLLSHPGSLAGRFCRPSLDLAYLLYKLYRNSLIHEGALSAEAKVVPDTEPAQPGAHTLSITVNNRDIHINEGALPIFREAVVDARCNGAEFGRRHFDFENREALTETLLETAQEFGTSVGRLMILSRALLTNPGYDFNNADDATCAAMIVGAEGINGGAMTGLASHQLADRVTRTITPKGIAAFRAVAAKVNVVEVFQ
ncbi:hypothetical protein [Ralstonia mannitolilytica]|uniref:hypothetical protein n=1 Tax=Ralstonia mannitolilytica TaxID=105219 RepID=UPI00292D9FBE|nr:hypothetical protein [Ralstonia mannitolilytica]